MYGFNQLKEVIKFENDSMECPEHSIYISPSTFEYQDYKDNILCDDSKDIELLHKIRGQKRESRMGYDNSEDAVTWNVFRFIEKENLLGEFIAEFTGLIGSDPEIVY